jgi:hypothetical protein
MSDLINNSEELRIIRGIKDIGNINPISNILLSPIINVREIILNNKLKNIY